MIKVNFETVVHLSTAYPRGMAGAVNVEAARRSFLTAGRSMAAGLVVRPEVLASWERSQRHDVDPDRIDACFLGHQREAPLVFACAEEVFDDFLAADDDAAFSLVFVDPSGVVRARR